MKKILFHDGWKCKKIGDCHEFNLSWQDVRLPHDAVIGLLRDAAQTNGTRKGFFPNGAWEYVKVFDVPKEWETKEVFLEFQGVQNHAFVYVNGNYVGKRAYAYSEFTLSLSKYLNYGDKNAITVLCRTGDDSRWYTGAGIYRDVNLMVAEKCHIRNNGVQIMTLEAGEEKAVIQVLVETEGEQDGCGEKRIDAKICLRGEMVASGSSMIEKKARIVFEIPSPKLWSEDTPVLYECQISLVGRREMSGGDTSEETVLDEAKEQFGIRTLSVDARNGLRVNGKQVRLRGACIHHDNGILGVRTFAEAEYRRVRILKEAGFNAIRSAHHPASRHLLRACDELGMYVMDESFDMWQKCKASDDYSNDFDENWQQDVRAMVEKDYNHPSVILYSIGNEISDLASVAGVALAEQISTYVKEFDATRFTTVAINGLLLMMQKMELAKQLSGETEEKKDINETMSSLDDVMVKINNSQSMDTMIAGGCHAVDIAGYNYMHHRYAVDMEKYPERVIVGSETYAKYIADMWQHIETHNNVIGDFTWTGWDYLGETGIGSVSYEARDYHQGFYGGYPYLTAGCGDIDITGVRQPQSYYREIVFGLRKEPYIAVHNPAMAGKKEYLSTWGWGDVVSSWSFDGIGNRPLCVDVYARGEVELFLNGKSIGRAICDEQCKCTFTVPYEKGILEAVSYREEETQQGQKKPYAYSLVSAGGEEVLKLSCETETPEKGELIFVGIALTDGNGVLHYGHDKEIMLEVLGGELLGFGNGASKTEESFVDPVHTTYQGRALAAVLVTGDEIRVKAVAKTGENGKLTEELILPVVGGK